MTLAKNSSSSTQLSLMILASKQRGGCPIFSFVNVQDQGAGSTLDSVYHGDFIPSLRPDFVLLWRSLDELGPGAGAFKLQLIQLEYTRPESSINFIVAELSAT